MAEQSSQSIMVSAAPADIMAVIADFPTYPEWSGSIKTCEVLDSSADGRAETVHFVIDAGIVKDDYVLRYDWAQDDSAVSWELVKGQLQKSQHGTYQLSQVGAQTRVTYSLTVDLSVPMLGLFKRKAEKVILDTALKELKKRVER
jgi:ribosome-associated toxin RatA of RatAB toxin-antitoxin module